MPYSRIDRLPTDFFDSEAVSVESLRDAWLEQRDSLANQGTLGDFNQRLIRRWAIETGVIERIYSLDRGTTEILVQKGLDASLIEHGASDLPPDELVTILNDHRYAAESVMHHVRGQRPMTLHFIKSIHGILTRHQNAVEAEDKFGNLVRVPLRHGEWKLLPNNPRRTDSSIHEYCPPEIVQDEMETLISGYEQLCAEGHPSVIRAAWLHHRFTQIHPFQDGNGRVARALTAFVLVKSEMFPIIVDRELRSKYIETLEVADRGDLRPLVRLFSMLAKKELEEALSLAESTITYPLGTSGKALRRKLLDALKTRVREKREAITAKRREVLGKGEKVFLETVIPLAQSLMQELQDIIRQEIPGSDVRLEIGTDKQKHFFKKQIVELAQQEGYYCDLETFHFWLRIRLQRHDEVDSKVNEIVVSLHSVGRKFTGVLALSAYFATRFLDEHGQSTTLEPHRLATRSLTLSYPEDPDNIRKRVEEWIDDALNVGIEHLRRSL
jgi:Fic family protein